MNIIRFGAMLPPQFGTRAGDLPGVVDDPPPQPAAATVMTASQFVADVGSRLPDAFSRIDASMKGGTGAVDAIGAAAIVNAFAQLVIAGKTRP